MDPSYSHPSLHAPSVALARLVAVLCINSISTLTHSWASEFPDSTWEKLLGWNIAFILSPCSLALPSQTPCLHAIAVSSDEGETPPTTETTRRLVWLAVSGLSPPTPTSHPRSLAGSTDEEAGSGGNEGVYLGPLSRLLSVCAEKHVFVHIIDLTSVLASMIGELGNRFYSDL